MERIQELFAIALDVFNFATSRGFYLLPFLTAAAYLVVSDNPQHKRIVRLFLIPSALGLLILLSPFTGSYAEGRDYIQITRFYWILPLDAIVAYCIADTMWKAKRPAAKGAFAVLLAFGILASVQQYNTVIPKTDIGWPEEKAANLYKVPAAVEETCDMILAQQNGAECRAAFPHELAMCVRTYNASIMMPYGSYAEWRNANGACYGVINADEINLDDVEREALNDGLDYFVLNQGKITAGTLQQYAEIGTVADGETIYGVYRQISDAAS